ncbi:hypothetical protein CLAFUW4_07136 [Fulvia fulva]|uniref:Uncharacterized protein n=1 Tax=Passalora fulva TaxID=5499 RepID=A0A9Q8PA33_PASFU|nr:uncharacterized protein CLAFUR5_07270 [Fulvia fulva]KAK4621968.1 hypothetical protein CLAFUR4_07145 [Fulvia fulva]KAK4623376.1 hypothetical protein CLAFUR0_07143 [Fulvia fulva]UJO18664.1 hypothetical protein CLAFUR5_07270 [Fulvia fulva]WPV16789.1 hypothetical protein CLAFUW4_07136 [Fulvia fulva]WPV31633.1 hypothetical protein CLAFUW7_07137 [Fulvia fulva]
MSGHGEHTPPPRDFWISPSSHIPPQTIALPAGDQIGVTVVQPLVMCFRTTNEYEETRFIDAVQTAAAGCLSELPALAGKLVWKDEARHRIECQIPESPKVQVRIKWLPWDAQKLDAQHWPPYIFQHAEVCLAPRPTYGIGTYNFGLQANIIRGGVIIVMHMNHTILDGSAQGVLQSIFAHHLGRAMDKGPSESSGLLPPVALDKTTTSGSHPARPILEWNDWKLAEKNTMSAEAATKALFAKLAKLTFTIWHISPEKLAKLRRSMQDPKQERLSMATCLSIWLWRAITRTRALAPDTVTRLLMPIQTRGRVKEVHQNYSGSALVYGRTKAKASEVSSLPAHELGARIGNSVAWWTAEKIREHWGSVEDCDDIARYQSNTNRDFGTDIECTHLSNFAFYNLHWGRGLQVRAYRLPGIAFTDGWLNFAPRLASGGNELLLYLARDTLEKLMKDAEFREYAEYWSASDPALDKQAAETERTLSRL